MIRIIAHRGEEVLTPEHTYPSYELCLKKNIDFIELDIRQSSDGEFYIFHDSDLMRIFGDQRLFSELDSNVIESLDAGSWFSKEFRGTKIPKLKDFLEKYSNSFSLYFDVKEGTDEVELIKLLSRYELREDLFFWFKDSTQESRFEKNYPDLRIKKNVRTVDDLLKLLKLKKPAIIETSYELAKGEFGDICRSEGVQLMIQKSAPNTENDKIPEFSGIDYLNTKSPIEWKKIF